METNRGDEDDFIYEDDSDFVNSFFLPGGILEEDEDERRHNGDQGSSIETAPTMGVTFPHVAPLPISASFATSSPLITMESSSELCMPWNDILSMSAGAQQHGGSPHSSWRFDSLGATNSNKVSFAPGMLMPAETTATSVYNSLDLSAPLQSTLSASLLLPPPPGFKHPMSSESFDSSSSLFSAAPFSIQQQQQQQQQQQGRNVTIPSASNAAFQQAAEISMFLSSTSPSRMSSSCAHSETSMGQRSFQSLSSCLGNVRSNNGLHHDGDNDAMSSIHYFAGNSDIGAFQLVQQEEEVDRLASSSYEPVLVAGSYVSQLSAHDGLQKSAMHQQEAVMGNKIASIPFLSHVGHGDQQHIVNDAPNSTRADQQEERRKPPPYSIKASADACFPSIAFFGDQGASSPSIHSGDQEDRDGFPNASSNSIPRMDAPEISPAETVSGQNDKQHLSASPVSAFPCDTATDISSLRPVPRKQQRDLVVRQQRTTSMEVGRKESPLSPSGDPPSAFSKIRASMSPGGSSTKIILPETVKAVWEAILALTVHLFTETYGLCRGVVVFCCRLVLSGVYFYGSVPFVLRLFALGLQTMCIHALDEAWLDLQQQQKQRAGNNDESNKRPALLFYGALAFTPMFCDVLMNGLFSIRCLFLPQWAPHIISNLVIYWLCRDASKSNVRKGEMQSTEIAMQFLRRYLPLYFVVACFLMDGFGEENSGIMLLPLPQRFIFAFVLVILDRGLLLSPVAWVSFALQVLIVYYFSCPHCFPPAARPRGSNVTSTWSMMLKEACIGIFVPILGLASIRSVGVLESPAQTMKSMQQEHQQQQKSATSTTTNRPSTSRTARR